MLRGGFSSVWLVVYQSWNQHLSQWGTADPRNALFITFYKTSVINSSSYKINDLIFNFYDLGFLLNIYNCFWFLVLLTVYSTTNGKELRRGRSMLIVCMLHT